MGRYADLKVAEQFHFVWGDSRYKVGRLKWLKEQILIFTEWSCYLQMVLS
jgi:hypothetical protein